MCPRCGDLGCALDFAPPEARGEDCVCRTCADRPEAKLAAELRGKPDAFAIFYGTWGVFLNAGIALILWIATVAEGGSDRAVHALIALSATIAVPIELAFGKGRRWARAGVLANAVFQCSAFLVATPRKMPDVAVYVLPALAVSIAAWFSPRNQLFFGLTLTDAQLKRLLLWKTHDNTWASWALFLAIGGFV
ncbi:MAG: hypothetical protein ACAI25_15790, partial [Planctomycetota bacterium]